MGFEVPAEAYDRLIGRYSTQLAPQLANLAGIRVGQRVVDVGCGPGALTAELVERVGPDGVCAVDPSESFVAAATARYPGVDVHLRAQGDAQVMEVFERGEVDLAIVSTSEAAPEGGLAVPLFTWRRAVIAPRGHALAVLNRKLTLTDLARHALESTRRGRSCGST
jgi:DNA-binding transcriptional LysR family regulator